MRIDQMTGTARFATGVAFVSSAVEATRTAPMVKAVSTMSALLCDPADEDACGADQFCNPDTLRCQDLCREHADCKEGRFCDADSGICQPGCRDDEGEGGEPNNDFETATVIPLGDANDDGERFGSIDGRVLCDNDEDVLRVDVPPGARVQIDVTFDQGTPSCSRRPKRKLW